MSNMFFLDTLYVSLSSSPLFGLLNVSLLKVFMTMVSFVRGSLLKAILLLTTRLPPGLMDRLSELGPQDLSSGPGIVSELGPDICSTMGMLLRTMLLGMASMVMVSILLSGGDSRSVV